MSSCSGVMSPVVPLQPRIITKDDAGGPSVGLSDSPGAVQKKPSVIVHAPQRQPAVSETSVSTDVKMAEIHGRARVMLTSKRGSVTPGAPFLPPHFGQTALPLKAVGVPSVVVPVSSHNLPVQSMYGFGSQFSVLTSA